MKKIVFYNNEKTKESGHLLLRVIFGFFLMLNGWNKLVHFSTYAGGFSDPFGIGAEASLSLVIFAELVCGLFILVGLLTRIAVLPVLITFIVAVFVVHTKDSFDVKQAALLYLFLSVYFIITGSGLYSLDSKIVQLRSRHEIKNRPTSAA